tara:strand:- start:1728 stop:3188 length:1461 start_codon:yes stop_codon:yes gene_type:complete
MDVSVVNVSLPHMRGAFGVDLSAITWIATSYSISQIIMITMTGWWSTVLGRKNFYLLSFLIFTVGSLLSATASSFAEIIIYRSIQGIGGGPLIPISQAILRETYSSKQQGVAMGLFGMGVVLAPAMGPVFGGWLTEEYGWPWVFFINIPFCVIGMVLVNIFIIDPPFLKRGIKKVDWGGICLLSITLVGLQFVLERGQEEYWFDSDLITILTVITVFAAIILVFWELNTVDPIINFRVLKNLPLSIGSLIIFIFGIALFGSTFLMPQLLQNLFSYSAMDAGLVLLPRGAILFIMLPTVGFLFNFIGARFLIFCGACFMSYTFYLLSQLTLEANYWDLAFPLMIMGFGMPCFFVTLSAVFFSTISPKDTTSASALYNLSRRIGGNLGYALLTTLLARDEAFYRIALIGSVSDLNREFWSFKDQIFSLFLHQQNAFSLLKMHPLKMAEDLITLHSGILSYNSVHFFLGGMFLLVFPMIFLIPKEKKGK